MLSPNLKGKVAIVTGSTSGIGLEIAQTLGLLGVKVVINGFGDIEAAQNQLRQAGVDHIYCPADLSKPAEIVNLFKLAHSNYGEVDILVNNAGIQHVNRTENFPAAQWDAVLAVNLSSAFHAIQLALPAMQQKNWGRIINIASVHGLVASVEKSAYVAAKHGLIGLTKVVALENAATGITCNAICPGWVLTPLVQKQIDQKAKDLNLSTDQAQQVLLKEKQPSLTFTTPDQIAQLCVFLCASAGDNVKGVAWALDGGWTAQ